MRLTMLRHDSCEKPSVFKSLSVTYGTNISLKTQTLVIENVNTNESLSPTFTDDSVENRLQLCDTDLHVLSQ